MLEIISEGFRKATDKLRGKTQLSKKNISEALDDVKQSLLEADVSYDVVTQFLSDIEKKALGIEVKLKAGKGGAKVQTTASDHFIQICQEELVALMGPTDSSLVMPKDRPAVIMMIGLQGAGKTTTTAKLANYLRREEKKRPLLVAADTYRPAAITQLKVLGKRLDIPVFYHLESKPVEIVKAALEEAKEQNCDLILIDTAGRITIDEKMMHELKEIKTISSADNTLLVCDSMMGQDAVTTAKAFHEHLNLTGVIMTKLDGDSRGGAALSIKAVTGTPIKFLGTGESLSQLEGFRPEGLASRILGMGDIVSLMEDFDRVADGDKEEEAQRMLQGNFNFKDFYEQISMIQKMGPLQDIMAKLPMGGALPKNAKINDSELGKIKAVINSMTEKERINPNLLNNSRVKRISLGSGRSNKDVQDLIKQFGKMRDMMGKFGKKMPGLLNKVPGMKGLSQARQLQKMASQQQGSMGGGMPNLGSMFGGMPPMGGTDTMDSTPRAIDRNKIRKARKAARQNRKKNRNR